MSRDSEYRAAYKPATLQPHHDTTTNTTTTTTAATAAAAAAEVDEDDDESDGDDVQEVCYMTLHAENVPFQCSCFTDSLDSGFVRILELESHIFQAWKALESVIRGLDLLQDSSPYGELRDRPNV